MLKQVVKMSRFIQALVILISVTIVVGPLYAQMGRFRQFDRPMGENSPSSFRQKEIMDQGIPLGEERDKSLLDRGTMLTQPSMSGLMYQVHVLGEVNNPGTYRIMASERLVEVLQRAGGVAERGSKRRIEIKRDGELEKRVDLLKFQLYGQLDHNPYLLDNDVVFVPLRNQTVQVVGAVKRPDIYELLSEKDVLSVIKLAGSFSTGVARNEPIRLIRFVDGEKKVIEISQGSPELSSFGIKDGDVVFIPNVVTAGHKFDYDISKIPGDNIFYPSYEDRVFVLGGVEMPGAYPFSPYYNVHQYISLAGGFTQLATRQIAILTPEGKRVKIKRNKDVQINPGDTILVGERRIPPEGWVSLFMSLGSFGLSTTATVLTLSK